MVGPFILGMFMPGNDVVDNMKDEAPQIAAREAGVLSVVGGASFLTNKFMGKTALAGGITALAYGAGEIAGLYFLGRAIARSTENEFEHNEPLEKPSLKAIEKPTFPASLFNRIAQSEEIKPLSNALRTSAFGLVSGNDNNVFKAAENPFMASGAKHFGSSAFNNLRFLSDSGITSGQVLPADWGSSIAPAFKTGANIRQTAQTGARLDISSASPSPLPNPAQFRPPDKPQWRGFGNEVGPVNPLPPPPPPPRIYSRQSPNPLISIG